MQKEKHNILSIQVLCALSLFLLFSICSLLLITLGAKNYKGILGQTDKNFNANAAVHYVTNKLHAYDKTNGIEISQINGVKVLILNEDTNNDGYHTVIYFYNGYICELLSRKTGTFKPESGQKVLPVRDFNFGLNPDGTISIVATDSDLDNLSTIVSLKSDAITEVPQNAQS